MNHLAKISLGAALCFPLMAGAQGIINNGAYIVMSGASFIYIDGGTNGDYTSQANGRITPSATGIIMMDGDWINNSANTGFTADAGTVQLIDAAQSIGGTNSTTFYNLTLLGTNTKTLNVNTSVGGVTTTTGVLSMGTRPLNLNSFNLTVTNPATTAVTYTTGYAISETNVAGNPSSITWNMNTTTGAFVYPFGTVSGVQIPFTFNKTTGTASNVRVATRPTAASDNLPWSTSVTHMYDPNLAQDGSDEAVIDRWWDITATAATNADVTFTYRGLENTLIVPYNTGNLGAQYWAAAWLPNNANIGSAPAVLAGTGSVTAPGLSFAAAAFTPMVLSSLAAPLPVELVSFTASCDNQHANVQWTTASESNNQRFDIERSNDGNNWTVAGTVNSQAPNGNSSMQLHYEFIDPQPLTNASYYRLTQVDLNGQTDSHNPIAAVLPCESGNESVNVFGQGGNELQLQINSLFAGDYSLNITDARGRSIYKGQVYASEGFNSYQLQVNFPATGVYFVNVIGSMQNYSQKLYITQ